ncbi:MAG: response regulator transcription factor [Chloroflexi bacterium]|nr:response regulator transcription factor [Chloroflexota bacterium]
MTNPLALIIEDDPNLATIFAEALRMAEFETEIAQDGQAALAQLAATTPTLVILDLHLPYVSGQTILQQIRADERLAKTRVLLATADALRAESLRGEADLVLLKPISPHQLRDLAKRLRPPDIIGLD